MRSNYIKKILSSILALCLFLSLLPISASAAEDVCKIGIIGYPSLDKALGAVPNGGTIELLTNINYNDQIVINDKTVYFGLNGFTLNVTYLSGDGGIIAGLIVRNGAAIAVGEGEMNIKGHQWGVLATLNSTVTVTNAEATGGDGLSANGELTTVTVTGNVIGTSEGVYADNSAKVIVGKNVSATRRAIYAATNRCEVTVHGNVIVTESDESLCGAEAFYDAKITIDRDITAVNCGAIASNGGEVVVGGKITVTGADNCGVWVNSSGVVSVEGTITAQNYIKLNDEIKIKDTGVVDGIYLKYTDGADCVVLVKKTVPATVFTVGTAKELKDALDSLSDEKIIKLTANIDYNDSVTIPKAVTFDVGPYVLNIIDARSYGIGLDVSGSVNLISTTGGLNVTGGRVGVRVWNGGAAYATVTNATATELGGNGVSAISTEPNTASVVVQGNVTADTGVYTMGSGSNVIVNGKVTAKKVGVLVESGGDIEVFGAIEAQTCGAQIVTDGTIAARKGVTVTGTAGVGVKLLNSGSMTIDGDITATNYINLGGTIKLKSDGVADPTNSGYTKYTDGGDRVIWVKANSPIDITSSFTDLSFLRAVRAKLGKDSDAPIYTADVAKVTSLDVSSKSIGSLAGIEHFTELITFNCSNNALKTLDVSHMTKLVNLYCYENQLTALDLSDSTELVDVRCYKNKLTTLNVSGLTKLTDLNCYENQLTVLDLSGSTELVTVSCFENKLTTLNINGLTNLTELYCRANQLTALNVSGSTKLTELYCSDNLLTELDVSNLPELNMLYCGDNLLTRLVLNGSADYSNIDARNNYMENESAVTGKNITWDDYRFRFSPQKTPQTTYPLIVQGGTGGGNYTKDSTVTIIANSAPAGQRFKEWEISPVVTFTDGTGKTDATAKFIMPNNAATAKAVFEPIPTYLVTVNSGTGGGNFAEGAIVNITAGTATTGKEFDKWTTSGGVTFADPNAASTSFTMPGKAVTVTATYKNLPDTTPPTGEISIGTNKWNSLWNTVTFGLLCKSTQTVTIAGEDNSGETVTVQYYLSETELTSEELVPLSWKNYSGTFNINPNSKQIVYVKLTDPSGNSTFINSAGIVIYTDSVAVTTSVNHVKGSGSKTAKVTLGGNSIAKIMNGGTALTIGTDYTVSGGTITLVGTWLDSLTSSTHTLTVYYNPLGVAYPDSPLTGSEAPATTSFTLTVTDTPPDCYAITVQNDGHGTANASLTSATVGTEITLTATANSGYRFKEWRVVSGSVTITGDKFTMPDIAVTVKAIFEPIPTYLVTVNSGTGGGNFAEGATVNVTAGTAPAGKEFDKWTTTGGVTFTNTNATSTSFTMPGKAVTVTATYKDLPPSTYAINVQNDGHGTANANATSAAAGTEITLTATANSGYRFKEWQVVEGGVIITGGKFTMPANTVSVKVIFEKNPVETPSYKITKGTDGNWKKGADFGAEIISDGDFSKFTGVKVDGALLASDKYTAASGSTVINFKPEYLATLTPGEHIVEIVYTDGSVRTRLTVQAAGTEQPVENPQTGDNSNITMLYVLMLLSGIGFFGTMLYGKKRRIAR